MYGQKQPKGALGGAHLQQYRQEDTIPSYQVSMTRVMMNIVFVPYSCSIEVKSRTRLVVVTK